MDEPVRRPSAMSPRDTLRTVVGVLLLVCVLIFIQVGTAAERRGVDVQDVETKSGAATTNKSAATAPPSQPLSQPSAVPACSCTTKRIDDIQGDLLNRSDILRLAQASREQMIEKIKEDYGEYFDSIFSGKYFTTLSPTSGDRLKRKLMIKVLEMQAALLKKGCDDCTNEDIMNTTFVKYVWATGGHSSAAGHGNLFDESYTAVLGRDARIVFEAIGIYFEDRNYAMGGTSSSSEVSMCWEQIFGSDVDFFSWDYGMTDGSNFQSMLHFGYRGGISPGRPAFMGKSIGGRPRAKRTDVLTILESLGMTVSLENDDLYEARSQAVPDSAAGLTQDQIDHLPRMVRNFKCGDQLERGEPFCRQEKYSKDTCAVRSKQAPWHPGFKSHAMDGHAMALFITEALVDALSDLAENALSDPLELLAELRKVDDSQYEQFLQAEIPKVKNRIFSPQDGATPDPLLDLDSLWKRPSLCRTGRTPSQARYLGYTTNSENVGGITIVGSEKYDIAIPIEQAREATASQGGAMVLVDGGDHEYCKDAVVKPDYKDYFYADKSFGWTTLSIPNEKERNAYAFNPLQVQGLILLALVPCDWGKCEKGDMRSYAEDEVEVKVNGRAVTEVVDFGLGVSALKGDNGYFWKPDENGSFVLSFLLKQDNGFIRLSSVIIY